MIKISVMYPDMAGTRFDHEYYRDKHMPLVQRLLGESCSYYTIDRGRSGSEPGSTPTYVAMCHIFSRSIDIYAAGMQRSGEDIFADIPEYTDIDPVIQISDVVVGYPASGAI